MNLSTKTKQKTKKKWRTSICCSTGNSQCKSSS